MSITYPYYLFIIKDNISYKKLEYMSNIFRTIDLTAPKSILENFKLEIDNNFKKNNMTDSNTFGILENLSILFNDYLVRKDINSLLNTLIDYKNIILLNKSYIENFMSITKNSINRKIYIENLFYYNPINSKSLEKGFLNNILIDDIINKHSSSLNDISEIKISLDILIYGDIINLSLPSIGIIDSLDPLKSKTFINFFEEIIKNDNIEGTSIKNNIPFISLNLGNKLADILLNISKNEEFNNINNINYNNTLKKLLSNMINKINVNLEEIYFNDKKIKNEFIIPYYFKKNRPNPIEIEESNKSMIDKIKDFPTLFRNNNELIFAVIDDINLDINNINKKNYKNVLACYLYYIINVGYKILYNYIDKIDDILTNFLNTKDKRFKILNIESAFEYTQLLKESLLKFKSILLNNFYNLFLPSNISDGYYGMKLNSNMCYISDEFSFMNDNIFDYYPFNIEIVVGSSIKIININNDILRDFICTINNKKDIYDKFELEFGGSVFDTTIQNNTIKILKEYYNKLQKNNKFNLFIINKIIYNFNINKSIPFELIDDLKSEIETLMKNGPVTINNKNKLERLLLHKYENNLEKSTKFYLKYINEKNKIKISKKTDIHSLYSREELYYLYFNTYFTISNCLYIISDKCIVNIKLKTTILKKFDEIKKKYENIIQDYLQK